MLGKAMYEGILVELPFAAFFLSKLRGRENELNDLSSLDADLYHNLLSLKRYEGDIRDLVLDFSVMEGVGTGQARKVDLVPGGRDVPVTAANTLLYIHRVANHRLNTQIKPQSAAFLRGFQVHASRLPLTQAVGGPDERLVWMRAWCMERGS
jgi:ubiquitin-protein ligase E3 C